MLDAIFISGYARARARVCVCEGGRKFARLDYFGESFFLRSSANSINPRGSSIYWIFFLPRHTYTHGQMMNGESFVPMCLLVEYIYSHRQCRILLFFSLEILYDF